MHPADPAGWPPPIVVHDVGHALSAADAADGAGVGLNVRTAPGSAAYLGLDWFRLLDRQLGRDFPTLPRRLVLDCGAETGLATLALRRGIAVRSDEAGATRDRLRAFAAAAGSWLDEETRPALDLLDQPLPDQLCRDWFERWVATTRAILPPSVIARASDAIQAGDGPLDCRTFGSQ